jgi:SHS2 domain-containing protein
MSRRPQADSGFEVLAHTADAGVRAWGPTRESLFVAVAEGLYALALTKPAQPGQQAVSFRVAGENDEDLLVHFLRELLFILDSRGLAAAELDLQFAPGSLDVRGDFARVSSADRRREIKSPTYHQLQVRSAEGKWTTEIYFDL